MSILHAQRKLSLGLLLTAFAGGAAGQAAPVQQPTSSLITSSALAVDDASHTAFVVDSAHDSVIRINLTNGARRMLAAGKEPIAIALDAGARHAYVVNAGAGIVTVLDAETGAIVAQPHTDTRPYMLAVDRTLQRAYVSNTFSDQVTEIDMKQNIAKPMPWGSKDAILVDEQRSKVFFTSYEDPRLLMLDETTGEISRVPLANHTWTMALSPATGHLLAAIIGSDNVVDFDPQSKQLAVIPVGKMPDALAISGDHAYVANRESSTVSQIRLSSRTVEATMPAGLHPQAVAVGSGLVWVASTGDQSVVVWNEACPAQVATLRTQAAPYGIRAAGVRKAVVAEFGGPVAELLEAPEHLTHCTARR